jgi:glutamate-ammonia-ligase adenylyltransferase
MEHEIARERAGSYNIKTGRGGMVDVEFVVQYLLLRYGRDYPGIRCATTLEALKAMRSEGIMEEGDFTTLLTGYKFLRRLENRLRLVHDSSMNDLGGSRDYLDRLARRLGYDPKLRHPGDALMEEYETITSGIRGVYGAIMGEDEPV